MASIEIKHLRKTFGPVTALGDISLTVNDGDLVTLLGPSGCGKTTMLRCLAGLETPDAGIIRFGDRVVIDSTRGTVVPPEKRNIGMMFQSYALWPHMRVAANVGYPLRLRGVRGKTARSRVKEVLRAVEMEGFGRRYPNELSGGQQQRVALARTLAAHSSVLLFDEPLSNLDSKLRVAMQTELRRLHREFKQTSVYVTHDQEEAMALSDLVVVMNHGKIEQIGTPDEIFLKPQTPFVADFMGVENILPATVAEITDSHIRVDVEKSELSFHSRNRADVEVGEAVWCAIRSEKFRVAEEGRNGQANTLSGTVAESIFRGRGTRVELAVADEQLVATFVSTRSGDYVKFERHEQLRLTVSPEDVLVIPGREVGQLSMAPAKV